MKGSLQLLELQFSGEITADSSHPNKMRLRGVSSPARDAFRTRQPEICLGVLGQLELQQLGVPICR